MLTDIIRTFFHICSSVVIGTGIDGGEVSGDGFHGWQRVRLIQCRNIVK